MTLVCGVDEAGRGPLAAVILDFSRPIEGLADSKQLSERQREARASEIRVRALAWSVASASVEEIDALNILQASLLAMRRAVDRLTPQPEEVLVDGLHCPLLGIPVKAIVKGDATIAAISAASILAKVARDDEMCALHRRHPEYGFDRHKGYPTRLHLAALRAHGVSVVHRRSFAPVRALLASGQPA
jgi:ribonuclease HII